MNLLYLTIFLYLGCDKIEGIFPITFNIPPNNYPWDVFVYSSPNHEFLCEGAIIHPKAVLTAAHCLFDGGEKPKDHSRLAVAVGKKDKNWNVTEANEQKFKVSKILLKDTYKGERDYYEDDIGILYIDGTIIENSSVKVAGLTKASYKALTINNPAREYITWRNSYTGPIKNISHDSFYFYDRQRCREIFPAEKNQQQNQHIASDKFCAVFPEGSEVKIGESGKGLVYSVHLSLEPDIARNNFIIGLASNKLAPGLFGYTNVTAHYNWVNRALKKIKNK